ncbi:MAG: hypothetical protein U0797_08960 [Gemmataceae bacterium]
MKTKFAFVALACVSLAVSGCGSSPQDLIVGKWEAGGPAGVKLGIEFAKDGKAKITLFGQQLEGTYNLVGDELVWTVNGTTTKGKVKVTATEMELTREGQTITYKRV